MRFIALCTALCLGAGSAAAQTRWPSERPPRPLPARDVKFPAYDVQTLPNGLQVVVVLHHEQPAVSMRLLVRAGSALDPKGKLGLASLFAAVLDQGTATKSAGEIADAIDFIGGAMGAGAGTDLSYINMILMKDSFETGIRMLSDVARRPAFAQEEIDRQKQQTLSGLQVSNDDPGYVADAVFDRLVFGFHPYGLPRNGTPESIAAITRDDLQAFHKRYFTPNNSILAIVGDVSADEAFATVKKVFGDWESRSFEAEAFIDPPDATRRVIVVNKSDAVQTEVRMGHIGIPRKHPDYMPLNLATRILGGEGSNRLHQILRTDRGLTYGAQADFDTLKESGDIEAETNTRSEATGEVVRLMIDEFWRMQRERVGERELDNAKAYLTGSFPLTIETPDAIAMQVLNVVFYGLPLEQLQNFRDRVNAVTVDDIQRVARTYYKPDHLSIVLVGNAAAFAPQLAGIGLAQFETIELENLDLTAANFQRAKRGAANMDNSGMRGDAGVRVVPASYQSPAPAPAPAPRPSQAPGAPAPVTRAPVTITPEEGAKALALLDKMITAKGGLARLRAIKSIKAVTKATVAAPNGPVEAGTITYLEYPDHMRVETTLPEGTQLQVYDGFHWWIRDADGVRELPQTMVRGVILTFKRDVIAALLAAKDGKLRPRLLPDVKDEETGILFHALELSGPDVDPFVLLADPTTLLVARQAYFLDAPGRPLIEEFSSDYKVVDGVQVAYTATVRQSGRDVLVRQVIEFKVNPPPDPSRFSRPAA